MGESSLPVLSCSPVFLLYPFLACTQLFSLPNLTTFLQLCMLNVHTQIIILPSLLGPCTKYALYVVVNSPFLAWFEHPD